jgi:hypothetical protein
MGKEGFPRASWWGDRGVNSSGHISGRREGTGELHVETQVKELVMKVWR